MVTNTTSVCEQLEVWQQQLSGKNAAETLAWAASKFREKIRFASSLGLEDQVLTDLIVKTTPDIEIFTLDTGRLFPETYDLIQRIEDHYKIKITVYFPDAGEVEEMTQKHGVNLFYQSAEYRKLCCGIRKIHPLKRALKGLDAWVCGLRQKQSDNRMNIQKIEWDQANNLVKINPVFDWNDQDIWDYIKTHNVPYNVLHDRNYPSIGCSCCTRAVRPGEDSRAGRWWWEQEAKKECGIHFVDGKIVRRA